MPATLALLDYDKAEITMQVSSQIERDYRLNACKKEPWTITFIESMKHGDVLWDVGANVGSYSLIAAARGNEVVAIEPGLANFNALLSNGKLNHSRGRIYGVNAAVGAVTEQIHFAQTDTPGAGEGGRIALSVQQMTIDELVFSDTGLPAPTHLKIDVDGHELSVLAGAELTFKDSPLRAALIEVSNKLGERVSDLMDRWGWARVAIYDKRNGNPIIGVRYEEFQRSSPLAEAA